LKSARSAPGCFFRSGSHFVSLKIGKIARHLLPTVVATGVSQATSEKNQEAKMLTKAGRDFILHITNYFHGHWEDPEWGKRPVNQVLIALALSELAEGIQDTAVRGQIQKATNETIARNTQQVGKTAQAG
jgi:hypothetical protein